MNTEVVVASSNRNKLAELKTILGDLHFKLRPQSDFNIAPAVEDGADFVENSLIKSRHASALSGLPAIADDSGLVVDILNGAPGIYSARYAGDNADPEANLQKLVQELTHHHGEQFSASFHCAASYVRSADDPQPIIAKGEWHGYVVKTPRGAHGFGYDPVFYLPEQQCTAAELQPALKNKLSHRARAFSKLREALVKL